MFISVPLAPRDVLVDTVHTRVCVTWNLGNSQFFIGTTSKLAQILQGTYYLYYPCQETDIPSDPEGDTISSLQGSLLC